MGRAARQVPERSRRSPTRHGSSYDDILKAWRDADSIDGKPYGIPYDGEVTVQVYRKDLYDAKGLKPADTYDELVANAKALTDPANRMYGIALRGFAGAGQNMYIYPSILRGFGGSWMHGGQVVVNSPEAVQGARRGTSTRSPPTRRRRCATGTGPTSPTPSRKARSATYIDAHSSAAVITNPEKSKVVGKIAYARWPKGPSGKRVTSIWNWGFPINAALHREAEEGDLAVHRVGGLAPRRRRARRGSSPARPSAPASTGSRSGSRRSSPPR